MLLFQSRTKHTRLIQRFHHPVFSECLSRPLSFAIPGLTSEEEKYLNSQTAVILRANPPETSGERDIDKKGTNLAGNLAKSITCQSSRLSIPDKVEEQHFGRDLLARRNSAMLDVLGVKNAESRERVMERMELRRDNLHYNITNNFHRLAYSDTRTVPLQRFPNCVKFKTLYLDTVRNTAHQLGFSSILEAQLPHPSHPQFYERLQRDVAASLRLLSGGEDREAVSMFRGAGRALPDTIPLLRSVYLVHSLLNTDLTPVLCSNICSQACSPLNLLLHLNVLQESLLPHLDSTARKAWIIAGFQRNAERITAKHFFHDGFPPNHQARLLREAGYTEEEVAGVLFSEADPAILARLQRMVEEAGSRTEAADTLAERREYLQEYGERMGLYFHTEIFKCSLLWPELVSGLNRAKWDLMENKFQIQLNIKIGNKVTVGFDERRRTMKKSQFLANFFRPITPASGDLLGELRQRVVNIPSYMDIPQSLVKANIALLVSRGFTVEQIWQGLEVLFFPREYLVETMERLDDLEEEVEDEQGGTSREWRREENALSVLAYYIEKESGFSGERLGESAGEDMAPVDNQDIFIQLNRVGSADDPELDHELDISLYPEDLFLSPPSASPSSSCSRQNFSVLPDTWSNTSGLAGISPQRWSLSEQSGTASPSKAAVRNFHTSPIRSDEKVKAKIFYLQNPLTVLKIYFKFLEVKQKWDPKLDQAEFQDGVRFAVAAISQHLSENDLSKLRGLVSRAELKRLKREVETEWSDVQKNNISLDVQDICKVVITDFTTQQIVENKYCDIEVMVMAVKRMTNPQGETLPAMVQIKCRLHREYTDGRLPDWIVTKFKVLKFGPTPSATNNK